MPSSYHMEINHHVLCVRKLPPFFPRATLQGPQCYPFSSQPTPTGGETQMEGLYLLSAAPHRLRSLSE